MTTPPEDPWQDAPRMSPEGTPPPPGYAPPPPPGYAPPPGYGPPPGYAGPPGFPPPGYGPPGYGYRQPSNGMGVTALVLGIVGALGSLIVVGVLLAVPAIVFGVVGRGKARRGEATNGGMATAGLVLGVVGTVLGVVIFVLALVFADKAYEDCLDGAVTAAQRETCERRYGRDVAG